MAITLRPAQADDEEFLYRLYASTRADELAAWSWDEAQQQAFLAWQFRAQELHYAEYENADHQIILRDGQPIGRLLLARNAGGILVVDIALLSEWRAQGTGAQVLDLVFAEAIQTGQPVLGHVVKTNRAQRLWWRLGFRIVGDTGTHYAVEWRPPTQKKP